MFTHIFNKNFCTGSLKIKPVAEREHIVLERHYFGYDDPQFTNYLSNYYIIAILLFVSDLM